MSEEEILYDFANNENTKYSYDFDGYNYEKIDDAINKVLEKNNQLQQENKELRRCIKIKDAYCQLIYDLGFDYDGLNQVSSLKGLIDELVKYAFASRNNDDNMVIYKYGINKNCNILNEDLEGDK